MSRMQNTDGRGPGHPAPAGLMTRRPIVPAAILLVSSPAAMPDMPASPGTLGRADVVVRHAWPGAVDRLELVKLDIYHSGNVPVLLVESGDKPTRTTRPSSNVPVRFGCVFAA